MMYIQVTITITLKSLGQEVVSMFQPYATLASATKDSSSASSASSASN